ncbi:MAG TPA: PAS domain S-box protein, partial [Pyrinomonadaceae bacterium]
MKSDEPSVGDGVEGLFRSMFEQSPQSIQVFAPDGRTLRVNRAWEQLWGVTLEQIGDYNVLEDRQLVAGGVMPYIERGFSGEATAIPAMLYDPDESFPHIERHRDPRRWVRAFIHPVKDAHGRISEVVLVHEDITERILAEQALRESEDRYRDLVENSHELICTHDLEGRVLSVNPWAARILGFERSSLLGMNIRDGLAPEHRDEFDQYLAKIKRDGFAQGVMQVRTAGGERRVWEYHNTLRTEGVETPVVRGMAHDVTERRQALAREQEARREAEAANQSKDEFLATLSHELRTPLTAVVGWASMLRHERLDDETTAHALEVIERNAGAQAQIIEDILDVSRIITGKMRLNMQTTDPALAVVAAVETIRPAAQAKGVALACSLDPQVGTVTADPDRLRQVAWNLLSNAVKFTPQGGRVEIRLGRAGGHVRLVVSDDGEGISPAFMPYIFERFRQADSSTTRKHGGLGLGLAIVRHLVEMHGGTVSAESEGAGAVFTVSLPVNRQHQPGADVPVGVSAGLATGGAGGESVVMYPALGGLRLLVVEDEEDTLAMLAVVFGRCGAEVKAVASTEEALSLLETWRPDVLVSDLGLPGEDGYSLIEKVREKESREGGFIPAVALSGYARTEDKAQALAAGYQLHLAKPVGLVE